jgi:uncharacterized protein (DUF2249 family)
MRKTNPPDTMRINAQTKIAALLKGHPEALKAIIGLSPGFNKLRNPVLRKLMAGRTTIAMAAKIGGCKAGDFFLALTPLGFEAETESATDAQSDVAASKPAFIAAWLPEQVVTLDVRAMLAGGTDPLKLIQQTVKDMQAGQVLKIINTFEPTPLIHLLGRQGFTTHTESEGPELVNTYFQKPGTTSAGIAAASEAEPGKGNWEELLSRFAGRFVHIDVRHQEMPQPMMTILAALDNLQEGHALYVHHKRIPVFLLDELATRSFSYSIKEKGAGEVLMLIFRDEI